MISIPSFSQGKPYPFNDRDRDPFFPLVSGSGYILIPRELDITELTLKGIIYSQGNSLAIINEEMLKEGDTVGEYVVLKIEEKKVFLKKGNKEFTLKLEEK